MLIISKLNILGVLCGTLFASPVNRAEAVQPEPVQTGLASWYGADFAGKLTANGEIFDPGEMTAAHRTLRFGTRVIVKNIENGASVSVRITDRGPYIDGRIIDLSEAAARRLGYHRRGVTGVEIYLEDGLIVSP